MIDFVKKFGRTPHRTKINYIEYRNIQELDKVVEQARTLLDRLGISDYEITKHPELKGFVIKWD